MIAPAKILANIVMIQILHFPEWKRAVTGVPPAAWKTLTSVSCAKEMKEPLERALACLKEKNAEGALKTYHGCFNYRNIRGTDRLSNHAFGRAIDINLGLKQPKVLVDCFEAANFSWGGKWSKDRRDPMHFELRRK